MNMQLTGRLTVVLLLVSLAANTAVAAEAVPEKWKSMDLTALMDEAWKLRGMQPAIEGRGNIELMAQYAAERYAAESASGKLKISEWIHIANILAKRLPAKTQEAMAKEIEKQIVSDRQAISKLGYGFCKAVVWTLTALGSDKGRVVLATWGEVTDSLQSAKPEELRGLANDLAKTGDVGKKARIRLVKHIEAKYLANAEPIESSSLPAWSGIVGSLAADISPEMRGAWADKLYSAFSSEASLAKMDAKTRKSVVLLLKKLGSKKGDAFIALWGEKTAVLGPVKPGGPGGFASDLSKIGEVGKKARIRLVKHIETKYMVNAKSIRSLTPYVWSGFVKQFDADIPRETRTIWADKFYSAFGDEASLAKMDAKTRKSVVLLLKKLGSRKGDAFIALWGEVTNSLQSGKPGDLGGAAAALAKTGDIGKRARIRLARHVEAKYMSDAAAVRSLSTRQWQILVECLGDDLDDKARAAWAGKLYSALIDKRGPSPRSGKYSGLSRILQKLGGKKDQGGLFIASVVDGDAWKSWNTAALIDLCMRLSKLGDKGRGALSRVAGHVEPKYVKTNAAAASVSCGQWWDFARYLSKTLSPESRKRWIGRLRSAYVDDVKAFGKLKAGDAAALGKALKLLGDKDSESVVAKWVSSQ